MGKQNLLSVVVADDEQELLGAVCQLIDWEGIGFRLVGRASNGLDALQLVEELQPDFLLTDIHMPFISGTALAAQVKAVQPLIQVAFLSGYDEFEYAQQGIACEVIAYLLKPISMAQLTQELIEIHRRIEKKLSDFSAARRQCCSTATSIPERSRTAAPLRAWGSMPIASGASPWQRFPWKKARRRRSARQRLARQKSFSRGSICAAAFAAAGALCCF